MYHQNTVSLASAGCSRAAPALSVCARRTETKAAPLIPVPLSFVILCLFMPPIAITGFVKKRLKRNAEAFLKKSAISLT
jgi:hypothetical protein